MENNNVEKYNYGSNESFVGKCIRIIGWIVLILGTLGSFLLGKAFPSVSSYSYLYEKYNWTLTIIGLCSSIISGLILVGFGELIEINKEKLNSTNEIKEMISEKFTNSSDNSNASNSKSNLFN